MDKLKFFGKRDSAAVYPLRDFLRRSVIDFEWIEVTPDNRIAESGMPSPLRNGDDSGIQFPDGDIVLSPTVEQVARHL